MVGTSYVGLYTSVAGIHGHESCTQEELVVADGVHGSHHCVALALPAEYRHRLRLIKRFTNLLLRCTGSLHQAVAVALLHGTRQDFIHLLGGEIASKRCGTCPLLLLEESGLQFAEVLSYSLLCIGLHLAVDRGIDL